MGYRYTVFGGCGVEPGAESLGTELVLGVTWLEEQETLSQTPTLMS